MAESFFKGGEGWAEEGSMGKGNKISRISTGKGNVGMMGKWVANIEFPKSGGWGSGALENDVLSCLMVTVEAVNAMWQPASHS